ncbi:hypothetical protein TNIN_402821 [Trichonephila inaurata madagascariensis]|uniref:Uncharacterized protein n=1 Tax=Trichonephila inaurata madagascariensis TaxID=2747483 RepID=A0A8X6MAL0_9ARAC|nr:hypothetical protein TNIN_402821 [Trichonephila inaurata madagascariensis]
MNVDSIRSNAAVSGSSAEIRIAKTAFCVILMFLFSWVSYITVAFAAGFLSAQLTQDYSRGIHDSSYDDPEGFCLLLTSPFFLC